MRSLALDPPKVTAFGPFGLQVGAMMNLSKLIQYGVVVCVLLASACTQERSSESSVGSVRSAITAEDNQVLGFERLSDWHSDTGAVLASTAGTQGQGLSVPGVGYRRVISVPIGSMGSLNSTASLQVKVDSVTPDWVATVELIVRLPSLELWYQPLGVQTVSSSGSFQTLTFQIPADIRTKLESSYSDLELLIALNGPANFVIDQLDFGAAVTGGTTPPPEPGPDPSEPIALPVPENIDVETVPLIASDTLQLTPGVEVHKASGPLAPVANAGPGQTLLEPDAKTGPITSLGPVQLSDRVEVDGDIISGGEVDSEGKTGIVRHGFADYQNRAIPLKSLPFDVQYPADMTREVNLQNSVDGSEEPGGFARLWVYSGSTLYLHSGRYAIDDFGIEPGARLVIDDSLGPVQFDVRDQFLFHGSIENESDTFPKFVLNYTGQQPLVLESAFSGRLTAPYTSVELATVDSPHRGWFYAKNIIVRPHTIVEHHSVASLLGPVSISNATPCAGEPFTVSASLAPGVPSDQAEISIGGVVGNERTFVFDGYPGLRFFTVTVRVGSQVQNQQFSINLQECEVPSAVLQAAPSQQDERVWDLWLEELDPGATRTFEWRFGDAQSEETSVPVVRHSYAASILPTAKSTVLDVEVTVNEAGKAPFVVRRTLSIGSVYALNRARGVITPHAQSLAFEPNGSVWGLKVQMSNVEAEELTVAASAYDYYSCSGAAPIHGSLSGGASTLAAGATETFVVTTPKPADPQAVCAVAVHFTGATASGAPAATSIYQSLSARRISAFDIPLTDVELTNALNSAAAQGLLRDENLVTEEELVRLLREGTLFRLEQLPPNPGPSAAAAMISAGEPCTPGSTDREGFFCAPTDKWIVAPGEVINAQRGDILMSPSCAGIVGTMLKNLSPTQFYSHVGIMSEDRKRVFSATTPENRGQAFPNDGDNSNFPGDGFDGDVLKFGWPGGIDQSINEALFGGYYEDPVGNTFFMGPFQVNVRRCEDDGVIRNIAPAVLKPSPEYDALVRPTLHELVDEAMSPSFLTHYRFFSYTDATIATERDDFGNLVNLAHGPFPDHTAWAENTLPAVCSTIIWAAAHRLQERGADFVLEGSDLEDVDFEIRGGARQGSEDGLYFYPESERSNAAQAFYDNLYNKVAKKDGTRLGRLFSDIADDIATQATMCFAKDECDQDAKDADEDEWQNPGDGNTVSPDNLMLWDSPETSGLYGYIERMMYVGSRVRRQFEWQPIASDASLTITVVNESDGLPREGATVVIGDVFAGNERTALTDANGVARFENLGVGDVGSTYPLTAGFVVPEPNGSDFTQQVYLFGDTAVFVPNLAAGQPVPDYCTATGGSVDCTAQIVLLGGDPNYRKAVITGNLHILDNDGGDLGGDHDRGDWDGLLIEQELGPFTLTASSALGGYCVDGEVEGKLEVNTVYVDQAAKDLGTVTVVGQTVDVSDVPVGTLVLHLKARIWEGSSWFSSDCDFDGSDEETPDSEIVRVLPGETVTVPELRALNEGFGDRVVFNMQVQNIGQFGSFPLPEPGTNPDLDPKRRLVTVSANHKLHDGDEIFNPDDEKSGTSEVSVVVDPWSRIVENSTSPCVDDEVVGELKVRARLLEDLESVEATVFVTLKEGDSCDDADQCGQVVGTVRVPRDESRSIDDLGVACFWNPVFTDSDSNVSFTGITVKNEQAPAPDP